jgi:3-hydroxyacyl-[acyl-carrier-protein] dehydratase
VSVVPSQARSGSTDTAPGGPDQDAARARLLFELDGVDLSRKALSRDELEQWNPHRGDMSLLDGIVWSSADKSRCVAVKHVRDDEFWVAGHFPSLPMMPGVLMIEAGAQAACYLFNVRRGKRVLAAFLRIEDASFRSSVHPGDTLHILCQEVKLGRRRFISDIQGVVGDRIAFEARISGMALPDPAPGEGGRE